MRYGFMTCPFELADSCLSPLPALNPIMFQYVSAYGSLVIQSFLHHLGKLLRAAFSPVVQKNVTRLLMRHVLVNGHDIDAP